MANARQITWQSKVVLSKVVACWSLCPPCHPAALAQSCCPPGTSEGLPVLAGASSCVLLPPCQLVADFCPALGGLTRLVMGANSGFPVNSFFKVALNHKLIYAEPVMAGCDTGKWYKWKFIEVEMIFFLLSICQQGKMGRIGLGEYQPRDVSLGAELTPRLRG